MNALAFFLFNTVEKFRFIIKFTKKNSMKKETIIDESYLVVRRLDISSEYKKLVFLVSEIESGKQFVLKLFQIEEQHEFINESSTLLKLNKFV